MKAYAWEQALQRAPTNPFLCLSQDFFCFYVKLSPRKLKKAVPSQLPTDLCTLLSIFFFSLVLLGSSVISLQLFIQCVLYLQLFIYTHICGCIPAELAFAVLNGEDWLRRKLSSGLSISLLPRPSQLLHTATLLEAQGPLKINCMQKPFHRNRQINSNL